MKYLKNIFFELKNWFGLGENYKYELAPDLPETIVSNRILIVGEPESEWLAVFRCPCGCGEIIYLNLLQEASPCWVFFIKDKKINLRPSISRENGCKSHFYIKSGAVEWV